MGAKKYGSDGKDLILRVPIGTLVFDKTGKLIADLNNKDQQIKVVKGGKGGLGNSHFSTSSNRTPQHSQPGMPGESSFISLELRLIAQVGLVGLPNAGKSSLLKALTHSKALIKDYPFTSLTPNLGTLRTLYKEIVIADIPGIISGASHGKGLGHQFLKHISRTSFILHLVAAEENPLETWNNYLLNESELGKSSHSFNDKQILAVLSKSDLLSKKLLDDTVAYFKENNIQLIPISSFTKQGLSYLIDLIQEKC